MEKGVRLAIIGFILGIVMSVGAIALADHGGLTCHDLLLQDFESGGDWVASATDDSSHSPSDLGNRGFGPNWLQSPDALVDVLEVANPLDPSSVFVGRLQGESFVLKRVDTRGLGRISLSVDFKTDQFLLGDYAAVELSYNGPKGTFFEVARIDSNFDWTHGSLDLTDLSDGLAGDNKDLVILLRLAAPAPSDAFVLLDNIQVNGCDLGIQGLPPQITSIFRDKNTLPVSPAVEITFDSEPGVFYDLLATPSLESPVWTVIDTIEPVGPSATVVDDPVLEERYYRVAVHGAEPPILSPNTVGVFPVTLLGRDGNEDRQLGLFALPLEPMNGTHISDVLGRQFTGSLSMETADWVWTWKPFQTGYDRSWRIESGGAFPEYDGLWFSLVTGDLSDQEYTIGNGIWAATAETGPQTVFLDGQVRTESDVSHTIVARPAIPARHLLGTGYVVPIPLDEPSLTALEDGATAGSDAATGDNLFLWDQLTDAYRSFYLGPGGVWFEGGAPAAYELPAGAGFWYDHRGDTGWYWTIPVPY